MKATVKEQIIKFFRDRENKPASFYTLMGARLATTTTLAARVDEMLEDGELVRVPQLGWVYIRLKTEADDEIAEPDIWESDRVPDEGAGGAGFPGDAPTGIVPVTGRLLSKQRAV
jgi:hypothetical protein